jgi:hypothetical protein
MLQAFMAFPVQFPVLENSCKEYKYVCETESLMGLDNDYISDCVLLP